MSETRRKIFEHIRAIGRAALSAGLQNSHSGNISVRFIDESGHDIAAITATGSQKGELGPDKVCYPELDRVGFGHYKASSETDIHTRVLRLPGVRATVHGHTRLATVVTMDDAPMPKENPRPPLSPVDALGVRYLGEVPVDWYAVASGSKEMVDTIEARLKDRPACIVQAHGTFARGATLNEAMWNLCLCEHSSEVVFHAGNLGVDMDAARKDAERELPSLVKRLPPYSDELDGRVDFADEPDTVELLLEQGFRIFESNYSPFHTGSMSIRCSSTLLYAPKASMPRELAGPLLELPLAGGGDHDTPELSAHRAIYEGTPFKAVMHCWPSEAEAMALAAVQSRQGSGYPRVVPVDAEGGFMHPSVPVLPANPNPDELCKALMDYKVAIVSMGGVWAAGEQAVGEALRHVTSIADICYHRIMAKLRGLDLEKMEPERARDW